MPGATAFADGALDAHALRFVPRRVMAGSDIVSEGGDSPACLVIKQGWAAPYKLLRDGRRQLLDLLMEQDGIRVCRDDQGRAFHSIVALTDSYVLEGTAEDLARFGAIQHNGQPCAEPVFAEQQRRMMDRMAILGHGRAAERLASCLLDLWRRQEARGNVDESGSCPIPIRQSDLGDAVGLTAVHVCRTLTVFRRLGLLEFANGRLKMLRPEKVAFIAGCESERPPYDV
ncbi:Crp/Fnr family transcriptional regulator [Dichotomicrobium thermohalophilum]|nr:Crp/Fnr family transcriptional regulator [Dichotomicrobium thermohalophilum]